MISPMLFRTLRTAAFRNLSDKEIDTDAENVFLVGENGQGKSNFLEALYFCSYASSFRGSKDSDLARNGEQDCSVSARFSGALYDRLLIKIERGKKSIFVDEKREDDRKALLLVAPSIVFCHEDMDFVSGPPERRRWFFDQTLSLCDPVYLEELRSYRRVLKSRNLILKDAFKGEQSSTLDVLDTQLIRHGLTLMEKRAEAAAEFSALFGPLYEKVSGISGISIDYCPSWKSAAADELGNMLKQRRSLDISLGTSLSGPHRDRYVFYRNGSDFSAKASTGQRRLLALLLRIAQAARYTGISGKRPILLLDDVLLELDPEKRKRFLEVMPEYDQAFFTFLPEEPYERYRRKDTLIYYVSGGELNK
ncbi:DNA replication and repair protein RecF [Treponema sp. OttesenSCG-928-L16]|nr:DNA replication and repair protein RecF [Treponema sp. OttesenSCG-928-L16]